MSKQYSAGGGGIFGPSEEQKREDERNRLAAEQDLAQSKEQRRYYDLQLQSIPLQSQLINSNIELQRAKEQAAQNRAMGRGSYDFSPYQRDVNEAQNKLSAIAYTPAFQGRDEFNKSMQAQAAADKLEQNNNFQSSVEAQRQSDLQNQYLTSETGLLAQNKTAMDKKLELAKKSGAQIPTGMASQTSQAQQGYNYPNLNLPMLAGSSSANSNRM